MVIIAHPNKSHRRVCEEHLLSNAVAISMAEQANTNTGRTPTVALPLYRSGTVNSNTVNSKFHLIRSYCDYLARILSFHV